MKIKEKQWKISEISNIDNNTTNRVRYKRNIKVGQAVYEQINYEHTHTGIIYIKVYTD